MLGRQCMPFLEKQWQKMTSLTSTFMKLCHYNCVRNLIDWNWSFLLVPVDNYYSCKNMTNHQETIALFTTNSTMFHINEISKIQPHILHTSGENNYYSLPSSFWKVTTSKHNYYTLPSSFWKVTTSKLLQLKHLLSLANVLA